MSTALSWTPRVIYPDAMTPEENASPSEPIDTNKPTDAWTLSEFYERYLRARRERRVSPGTIEQDNNAMNHWRRLTDDPPMKDINEDMLDDFVDAMMMLPGQAGEISPNTVCKVCRHLRRIMGMAGPRNGPRRRRAAQVLQVVPYLESPPDKESVPRPVTPGEFAQLLAACERMPAIDGIPALIPPAEYWRTLLIAAWTCGARIGTLLGMRWAHRRKQDDIQAFTPHWFTTPASVNKLGRVLNVYLPDRVVAVAEQWRTQGETAVFPWKCTRSSFDKHRRRLFRNAGLLEKRVGFHSLRKSLATWLMEQDSLDMAGFVLGHRLKTVTAKHYPMMRRKAARLVEQVPIPG